MTEKIIIRSTPPNLLGQPDNKLFRKPDFEALIFQKGYRIIHEQAIACPCRGKSGEARPTCQNCLGYGYAYINPVETKGILTSLNHTTKYQQWSPELVGTINVTVRDSERLSILDKITLKDRTSVMTEVRPMIQTETERFIFCSYPVQKVNFLFVFSNDTSKLVKLTAGDFEVVQGNNFIIKLSNSFVLPVGFNGAISIDYEYHPSYVIVDIPHDIRATFIYNQKGQLTETVMPVQGVARKTHIVLGEPTNRAGTNLLNNSDY